MNDTDNTQTFTANKEISCSNGFFGLHTNSILKSINPSNLEDDRISKLLNESMKDIPVSCCDGFFCPQNLQCMLPCPAGSLCIEAIQARLFTGLDSFIKHLKNRKILERFPLEIRVLLTKILSYLS